MFVEKNIFIDKNKTKHDGSRSSYMQCHVWFDIQNIFKIKIEVWLDRQLTSSSSSSSSSLVSPPDSTKRLVSVSSSLSSRTSGSTSCLCLKTLQTKKPQRSSQFKSYGLYEKKFLRLSKVKVLASHWFL